MTKLREYLYSNTGIQKHPEAQNAGGVEYKDTTEHKQVKGN